jgi:hypothetical protein
MAIGSRVPILGLRDSSRESKRMKQSPDFSGVRSPTKPEFTAAEGLVFSREMTVVNWLLVSHSQFGAGAGRMLLLLLHGKGMSRMDARKPVPSFRG